MKRANGTGSVVKLAGGRRRPYAVRVSYQERPGLWKQRYLSYHRTSKEAQEALGNYLGAAEPKSMAVTLGDIYRQWSDRKYQKAGLASVASYKASWERLKALQDVEMFRVTIDALQKIIDQDAAQGLSKSSITNDKMLMKALFKHAMERDIVTKDYSAFVDLPAVGAKYEKGAFDQTQMERLEEMVHAGFPWADTVLMLCYTGFRVSEFLGLTPDSYHPENDGYLTGGLKTAAGKNRIVPIHPKVLPLFQARLARGGERIVCLDDGRPVSSARYRGLFSAVVKELGTPQATPHWCRHTAASRMKMAGVDDLAVRRILGHSDKDITEHYTHIDVDFLRTEIRKMA